MPANHYRQQMLKKRQQQAQRNSVKAKSQTGQQLAREKEERDRLKAAKKSEEERILSLGFRSVPKSVPVSVSASDSVAKVNGQKTVEGDDQGGGGGGGGNEPEQNGLENENPEDDQEVEVENDGGEEESENESSKGKEAQPPRGSSGGKQRSNYPENPAESLGQGSSSSIPIQTNSASGKFCMTRGIRVSCQSANQIIYLCISKTQKAPFCRKHPSFPACEASSIWATPASSMPPCKL